MSEEFSKLADSVATKQDETIGLVGKLFDVAQPGAVFGEPITAEGHTVITASEIVVGMGYGYGVGGGTGLSSPEDEPVSEGQGFGGGGGGGGTSRGRPVAAITISSGGVEVEPIVDVTKIGLAAFTTLGAMALMLSRMLKASKG